MSDPIEALLNSPRSKQALKNLGLVSDDIKHLTKEELKVKLGRLDISRSALKLEWEEHENTRKNRIN